MWRTTTRSSPAARGPVILPCSSLFAMTLLTLASTVGSAGPPASAWHTLEIENLGCQVSVPLESPGDECSVRVSGDGKSPSTGSGEVHVRVQNYTEAELIWGEVPQMRPGQFFLEIRAEAAAEPVSQEAPSDCGGPAHRFPAPAIGGWCLYDPALIQGEASITHVAWLRQGGVQYRLQLDGSKLDEGEPSRLLTSFGCTSADDSSPGGDAGVRDLHAGRPRPERRDLRRLPHAVPAGGGEEGERPLGEKPAPEREQRLSDLPPVLGRGAPEPGPRDPGPDRPAPERGDRRGPVYEVGEGLDLSRSGARESSAAGSAPR